MILLYANPIEVKYVKYEPKVCIGYKASKLDDVMNSLTAECYVVLFGMSGGDRDLDIKALHNGLLAGTYDMETEIVQRYCKGVYHFESIRYIIDYNHDKVMPTGINWAWRRFQHHRMQLKFNRWIDEHYF